MSQNYSFCTLNKDYDKTVEIYIAANDFSGKSFLY